MYPKSESLSNFKLVQTDTNPNRSDWWRKFEVNWLSYLRRLETKMWKSHFVHNIIKSDGESCWCYRIRLARWLLS